MDYFQDISILIEIIIALSIFIPSVIVTSIFNFIRDFPNKMKDKYYLYKIKNDIKIYPKEIINIIHQYNPNIFNI